MEKTVLCIFIVSILIKLTFETLQEDIAIQTYNKNDSKKTLSRKKRYLVFPEGSSLQLVYCLTIPSVGVGQIFTLGGTAALAWELPHDPVVPFRKPAEVLHRMDEGIKDPSNDWSVKKKIPMKTYYNPYSINDFNWIPSKSWGTSPYAPATNYVEPVYHKIYRRTRRDLYTKVENFFTALSKDGKACLRKAVCEVSQVAQGKGSFMEEIIKAIFRVKPHDKYPNEDEYDKAANKNHNCTEVYPTCSHSVWGNFFNKDRVQWQKLRPQNFMRSKSKTKA